SGARPRACGHGRWAWSCTWPTEPPRTSGRVLRISLLLHPFVWTPDRLADARRPSHTLPEPTMSRNPSPNTRGGRFARTALATAVLGALLSAPALAQQPRADDDGHD